MNLEKYKHLAFFADFRPEDIESLAPFFSPQTWVAGTVVFKQGDYAEYFYLVVSGELTIRFKPHDGPVMNVARIQPGGIFGWSAAMGNPAYTSGAVCTLDSEVLRIRGVDLRTILDKHPDLGNLITNRLSAIIAERQQAQQRRVNTLLTDGLRQQSNN